MEPVVLFMRLLPRPLLASMWSTFSTRGWSSSRLLSWEFIFEVGNGGVPAFTIPPFKFFIGYNLKADLSLDKLGSWSKDDFEANWRLLELSPFCCWKRRDWFMFLNLSEFTIFSTLSRVILSLDSTLESLTKVAWSSVASLYFRTFTGGRPVSYS